MQIVNWSVGRCEVLGTGKPWWNFDKVNIEENLGGLIDNSSALASENDKIQDSTSEVNHSDSPDEKSEVVADFSDKQNELIKRYLASLSKEEQSEFYRKPTAEKRVFLEEHDLIIKII